MAPRYTNHGWRGDNPALYDTARWGSLHEDPLISDKAETILRMVPEDVVTVLGVGCGDGAITNVLGLHYVTTGVDRSPQALRHVRTPSVLASAESLPFADASYDLVLCSQLLEHLPDGSFEAATLELSRVARRWMLIGVPNDEDLAATSTKCPACGTAFHVYNHVRAFHPRRLARAFPEYRTEKVVFTGRSTPRSSKRFSALCASLGQGQLWYSGTICPACGNTAPPAAAPNLFDRAPHFARRMAGKLGLTKPYWMLMLLQNRTPSPHDAARC